MDPVETPNKPAPHPAPSFCLHVVSGSGSGPVSITFIHRFLAYCFKITFDKFTIYQLWRCMLITSDASVTFDVRCLSFSTRRLMITWLYGMCANSLEPDHMPINSVPKLAECCLSLSIYLYNWAHRWTFHSIHCQTPNIHL